jgi:hypothetical protein
MDWKAKIIGEQIARVTTMKYLGIEMDKKNLISSSTSTQQ